MSSDTLLGNDKMVAVMEQPCWHVHNRTPQGEGQAVFPKPTGVTVSDSSLLLLPFLFFLLFLLYETLQILCCVNGRRKTAFFFPPSVIYLSLVSKRGPLPLLPSLPSLFPILVHELIVKMMKQFPSHPCEWVFVLFPLYHRFLQNGRFSLRDTRYHMIYFFLVKIERHRHLAIRLNSQVSR